jgi:hypothetical protein
MDRISNIVLGTISTICIVILVVCYPVLAQNLSQDSKYFSNALLPALVALCVEGLLFVGIVTLVQKAAERTELAHLQGAITAELKFLFDVVGNCLSSSELAGLSAEGIDFSSPKRLGETMRALNVQSQEQRIEENAAPYPDDRFAGVARSVADAVETKAGVHLRRLQPLTPVAATFGAAYLTHWLSVIDQLYSLTREEGFDEDQTKTWGETMPFEYYYDRVVDLFYHLDALRV